MNTKPSTSIEHKLFRKLTKAQKAMIAVGVVVVLYVISLFIPWVYPYTRYPVYFVKCAGAPVAASDYSRSYNRPSDRYYGVSALTDHYFCTEDEAKAAGYHHNRLND